MRERLNVTFQGKRTTARFPEYLWRLALIANQTSDEKLSEDVRDYVKGVEPFPSDTASKIVVGYLASNIEVALFVAGFNPGNSRAGNTGHALADQAAEAQTNQSEEPSREGTPSPLKEKGVK